MQNLEQIRAGHAHTQTHPEGRATKIDKRYVNKLPAMIINNGLLATAAFAQDGDRPELVAALDAVAAYLKSRGLINSPAGNCGGMIQDLSQRPSLNLQRATTEALAYLAYLKRFATKGGSPQQRNETAPA